MSIVCALGNWIGSDTASICDGLITPCGPKWVLGDGFALGVAGDLRTQTLIEYHKKDFAGLKVGAFVEALRALFKSLDYASDATIGPPSYGSEFILVKDGIWEIDSALSVIEAERFAAIGSGMRFALGALFVCSEAESALRMALEAAIKYDAGCNGGVWMKEL